MTEKQDAILQVALQLFATENYHAVATKQLAKAAGVSEGLLFRHFTSKEGLLQAVLQRGEARVQELYAPVLAAPEPTQVLRRFIALPFAVPEADYLFWKLQFTLEWELLYDYSAKQAPVRLALENAFRQLAYPSPKLEAAFLMHYLDGLTSELVQQPLALADK